MSHVRQPLEGAAAAAGPQILFVDDDFQVREASERMLRRLGYQVQTFGNPLEALEAFRVASDQFVLLITDLTMPEMRGDELGRRIRRLRPGIPIVIASGYLPDESADTEEIEECRMMSKPFTLTELRSTVESALECALTT